MKSNMNKVLITLMLSVLCISGVFAYGGSGAGVIVFGTEQRSELGTTFEVEALDFSRTRYNIIIDCAKEELFYESSSGKQQDQNYECGGAFEYLELSQAEEFEVYVGETKFGVRTEEYGNVLSITINGTVYETYTNYIQKFPGVIVNVTVNETEVVNETLVINFTKEANESNSTILNASSLENTTLGAELELAEVKPNRNFLQVFFDWITFWN